MSLASHHDLRVSDRRTVSDVVDGRITIGAGGYLELTGSCDELVVESEGHAIVRGTVRGNAVNRGGHLVLEASGVVSGRLVEEAGETRIEAGARIASIGPQQV